MTARDWEVFKTGGIRDVCQVYSGGKRVQKEGTLVILRPICQCSEKVSENPRKVQNVRQIMAVQDGKCSKPEIIRYFSEKCLKAPEKCRM